MRLEESEKRGRDRVREGDEERGKGKEETRGREIREGETVKGDKRRQRREGGRKRQ